MDRKSFLQKFGMGIGAVILTPSIVKAALIEKPDNIIMAPKMGFEWNQDQIFIRVINTNPDPAEIMLFGTNYDIEGNFMPTGMKVQVAGGTYHQLQMAIRDNPVRIRGLRMQVINPRQFDNPISLFNVLKSGGYEKRLFQPLTYNYNISQKVNIIDSPDFELLITPSIYLMTNINPHEQVDYIFYLAKGPSSVLRQKTLSIPSNETL